MSGKPRLLGIAKGTEKGAGACQSQPSLPSHFCLLGHWATRPTMTVSKELGESVPYKGTHSIRVCAHAHLAFPQEICKHYTCYIIAGFFTLYCQLITILVIDNLL